MIRGWIKTGAARVMSRTGLDKFAGSLSGAKGVPLVIGYHRVVEDFAYSAETSIPSMLVSRGMLERHLDWIGRRFRFVQSVDFQLVWQHKQHHSNDLGQSCPCESHRAV